MNIAYTVGDATAPLGSGHKYIVHCCNDSGAWATGFVVPLARRWPVTRQRYMAAMGDPRTRMRLGDIQPVPVEDDITVVNLIGQHGFGRERGPRAAVRYDAINQGLLSLNTLLAATPNASLHMPMMGAGLAGGVWRIIEAIVESTITVPTTCYVLHEEDLPVTRRTTT